MIRSVPKIFIEDNIEFYVKFLYIIKPELDIERDDINKVSFLFPLYICKSK